VVDYQLGDVSNAQESQASFFQLFDLKFVILIFIVLAWFIFTIVIALRGLRTQVTIFIKRKVGAVV
jgi:hypothetical protein